MINALVDCTQEEMQRVEYTSIVIGLAHLKRGIARARFEFPEDFQLYFSCSCVQVSSLSECSRLVSVLVRLSVFLGVPLAPLTCVRWRVLLDLSGRPHLRSARTHADAIFVDHEMRDAGLVSVLVDTTRPAENLPVGLWAEPEIS